MLLIRFLELHPQSHLLSEKCLACSIIKYFSVFINSLLLYNYIKPDKGECAGIIVVKCGFMMRVKLPINRYVLFALLLVYFK